MFEIRCSCCKQLLPYVPSDEYKYFAQNNKECHWFCNSTCITTWQTQNPNFFNI